MKNTLFVNHVNRTIVMDRTFAKYAANTRTEEYAHLQQVRQDYPTYEVVQRHIKTNENKNTYKGLTYEYMEDYIFLTMNTLFATRCSILLVTRIMVKERTPI